MSAHLRRPGARKGYDTVTPKQSRPVHVLDVPCPVCKVEAKAHCLNAEGNPMAALHRPRRTMAVRAEAEKRSMNADYWKDRALAAEGRLEAVIALCDTWDDYDAEGYAAGDGPDWVGRIEDTRTAATGNPEG